jgi:hypothetical protein
VAFALATGGCEAAGEQTIKLASLLTEHLMVSLVEAATQRQMAAGDGEAVVLDPPSDNWASLLAALGSRKVPVRGDAIVEAAPPM